MRLVALTLLAPIVVLATEIAVLIGVAHLIGLGPALLILAATTALGVVLTVRAAPRAWQGLRNAVSGDASAIAGTTDTTLWLVAALLLAVPGFVTDVAGAILLLRPVRRLVRARIAGAVARRVDPTVAGRLFGPRTVRAHRTDDTQNDSGTVVDGEIIDV